MTPILLFLGDPADPRTTVVSGGSASACIQVARDAGHSDEYLRAVGRIYIPSFMSVDDRLRVYERATGDDA